MRTIVEGTPEDRERLRRLQAQVAEELPELIEKGERLHEAALEKSLSGELRRSIHNSRIPLTRIASDIGIDVLDLDRFLTGEGTISSDAMDRLAETLGYTFGKVPQSQVS